MLRSDIQANRMSKDRLVFPVLLAEGGLTAYQLSTSDLNSGRHSKRFQSRFSYGIAAVFALTMLAALTGAASSCTLPRRPSRTA